MKIKITKFKTVENLIIEVPAQIKGGNGLGKSTILEAISFVLTGKNLDGKEFEQVYDNRADLHDAIADVSYFDNYGNEFQRIVNPIFQTNRAGVEEIKIKRSTECRKNSIPCNDFSDEFQDFYKFGTDYFFNQKEDIQRQIFIDILKSKLPDYDVNSVSLKLKELKKSQKIEVDAVKNLQDANKNTKDVEVPEMPTKINNFGKCYSELNLCPFAEIIGAKAINENNAKLITERSEIIKEKQINLLQIIDEMVILESEISKYFSNLTNIVKSEFSGDILIDVELLEHVMSRDEYKDCFKITANGKVFPYECNGALQNNVKMQILYNLQRLRGYTGITIMDNAESNTTQPINTLGLNCVLAGAGYEWKLTIK